MTNSKPAIKRDYHGRDMANAGKTVYKDGYNVTYNEDGYMRQAIKVKDGGTRAPSADAGSAGRDGYSGSDWDKQYLSTKELAALDEVRRRASAGELSWQEANWEANRVRSRYGYTGGRDGSGYTPIDYKRYMSGGGGSDDSSDRTISDLSALLGGGYLGQYGDRPSYDPMYQEEIGDLLDKLLNSTYQDFQQSDDYSALYDKYSAGGQKAMQDVLGQLSARTGGYASSYATAAAGQAYNDYMATLEDAARAMYADQMNQQLQNIGILTDAENTHYQQYLTELDQWNTDRNFAYNQYLNNRDWQYTVGRQEDQDALQKAETLAAYGDFSGYKALGYSDAEIKLMQAAYQSQLAAKQPKRSNVSSGGGNPSPAATQNYEGLFRAAQESGYPKSWLAQSGNYKKYGFTSSSGLYDEYQNWISERGYDGVAADLDEAKENGVTNRTALQAIIQSALKQGYVNQEEAKRLSSKYLGSSDLLFR